MVYERAKFKIQGFKFTPLETYPAKITRKYNKETEVTSNHGHNPTFFLEEFLSVRHRKWYQKMFFEGKVFIPIDTEVFVKRNLEQKEHFEILKIFGIVYEHISYKVLKIKHIDFSGKEEIIKMLLTYDDETERYYLLEEVENAELAEILNVFYKVKQNIGVELTKVGYRYNFPPSGNQTLDKYIDEAVYQNFGLGYSFNISRFISMTKQWEQEGKTGLLHYFFEN